MYRKHIFGPRKHPVQWLCWSHSGHLGPLKDPACQVAPILWVLTYSLGKQNMTSGHWPHWVTLSSSAKLGSQFSLSHSGPESPGVNQGHAKRIKPSVLRSCTKHCQQQHTKHCRWASSVQELSSCFYCLFGGGLFISAYHCLCRVIYPFNVITL